MAQKQKAPPLPLSFHAYQLSWLNQVERWFGLITDRMIRRGTKKPPLWGSYRQV